MSTEQISRQQELIDKQEELLQLIAKQRNEAYKELSERSDAYPWYFWTVVGVASGVVLVRGLR